MTTRVADRPPSSPAPRIRIPFGIPERHLPALCLVGAAIIWGSTPVVTKVALGSVTPFALSAVRWSLSAAVMMLLLRRRGRAPVLTREVAATALFGMVAFTIMFTFGIQRTTAANATLISAAAPMLIALLSAAFLGEAFTRRRGVGIALSLAGVAVIVGGATLGASVLGNALIAGSALCFAVFTVLVRRYNAGQDPLAFTAGTAIFGLVVFLPAAVWEVLATEQQGVRWPTVFTVIYLALGPSLASYLLYGYALSHLPASQVAVWSNLVPVVGIATAALALSEPITALHVAGGALVFLGVWLGNRADSG